MTLTLPAGHEVTASEATQITDVVNAFDDALIDYSLTFTITGSTTNPTKGNSTYSAKYLVIGKMMWYTVKITIGSTFSAGSGTYSFPVPLAMDTSVTNELSCKVFDSGTTNRVAACEPISSTALVVILDSASSQIGSAGPGTAWATGDSIVFSGWLRLA